MGIGFVIMPFGGFFDEIYKEIYAPAIESVGLTPLRADEIYNNQPIAQDINHSIHNATVILADVSGKNPNVNYELGAAHALGKEVIITTADGNDVPSDYRHIRYIEYRRGELDWNRKFFDKIQKTLQTVLSRLADPKTVPVETQPEIKLPVQLRKPALEEPEDSWEASVVTPAIQAGFDSRFFHRTSSSLLYEDSCVRIDVRNGSSSAFWAPAAYLINENVRWLAAKLPRGHFLKMRWLFIDNYATHGFGVDYIYSEGSLPIFTSKELFDALSGDLMGQIFQPQIRYLEEDIHSPSFSPNAPKYSTCDTLPNAQQPICWRNGFYIAEIDRVYQNGKAGHCFYCLKERLPLAAIGAASYAPAESHWLADWNQTSPCCVSGDLVRFKLQKIYGLASWNHTPNARNVGFSELTILK